MIYNKNVEYLIHIYIWYDNWVAGCNRNESTPCFVFSWISSFDDLLDDESEDRII